MIKNTVAAFSLLLGTMAYAQTGRVGVNTHEPKAAMDINAITADNAKGILIPRLNATLVKNITPSLTADQHSMLAFITEEISTSERAGNYELISGAGYYYWDWNGNLNDSRWVRVSGKFETDLRRVGNSNHITIDAGAGGTGTSAGTGESNVAIGKGSLNSITTGSNNVAVGLNALNKVTTGSALIAIGQNALRDNTAANNTAIGSHALLSNTTGSGNIGVGSNALRHNTTGPNNVALGTNALGENLTGANNVAIGVSSLAKNTAGNNVGIGPNSLSVNTTGQNNVAIGPDALKENIEGKENIAIGFEALRKNKASNNIAIGKSSMLDNTEGKFNIAVGSASLQKNTTGNGNVAIGQATLQSNTTGQNNIALGLNAMLTNTTGTGNVGIGSSALRKNTTGSNNLAIGSQSLNENTTGGNNVALVAQALNKNLNGSGNIAIGYQSLFENTAGSYNIAMGSPAMKSNISGGNNIALGNQTLDKNTTGESNIALNAKALENNTTGRYNIAMGFEALRTNQVGIGNYGFGYRSLYHSLGDYNTGLGYISGTFITNGSGNMHIGNMDNANGPFPESSFNNTIFIGHRIVPPVQTNAADLPVPNVPNNISSNAILLGNNVLSGQYAGPKVGIGTYQPKEKLDVEGAIRSHFNANIGGHVVLANNSKISDDGKLAVNWKIYNLGKQTTGNKYTNSLQFWSYGQKTDGDIIDNKSQMMLTDEGKLAIGFPSNHEPKEKLEITGAIKLNTTSTECNTDSQGTLRFNTGTKKFQGCDGTSWVNLH